MFTLLKCNRGQNNERSTEENFPQTWAQRASFPSIYELTHWVTVNSGVPTYPSTADAPTGRAMDRHLMMAPKTFPIS